MFHVYLKIVYFVVAAMYAFFIFQLSQVKKLIFNQGQYPVPRHSFLLSLLPVSPSSISTGSSQLPPISYSYNSSLATSLK